MSRGAGKHMASGKMAENDPAASDDAERADQISTLLKLVRQNLAGVESWLTMDKSGWEEINGLFDADGPIAKCLQHLPKFSGHNALSVGEALAALKHRFLGYIVQISESDKFREICDELGAVRRETADLAANIRARKLIGRILDLDPVLSALDEFARLVEVRRKHWGSKRTAHEFVREAIMILPS